MFMGAEVRPTADTAADVNSMELPRRHDNATVPRALTCPAAGRLAPVLTCGARGSGPCCSQLISIYSIL